MSWMGRIRAAYIWDCRKIIICGGRLLTGKKNTVAQFVYGKLGYIDDNELHLSKQIKR